ncbi:MAG TPA: TRAP transporter small permease [Alphaproteobacteria bacterium]|jgi:TRAP-type C4-dicarboxylate transport system permease small subunit|nr:TRAP transporter small permease [Alphaproteobacteria bacterium]
MGRFLTLLFRVEAGIAATAYAVVAGLLLSEIIARDLFASAIWGSLQVAVFAAIVAGFLGLSLATGANTHLRPQFADAWWPEAWRPAVARLGDLVSCLLFAALGVIALLYIRDTFVNGDRAAVLYWPLWPIQLVLPYAFFSSAVRHLVFALRPELKPDPADEGA